MEVRFTKMHGAGNDFIVIDARDPAMARAIDAMGRAGCRDLADRHTGIGCDQILVLYPPGREAADVRVRIFNSDGSGAAQCGNGMRCITRFLADASPGQTRWCLESETTLMQARIESDGSVSVELGVPAFGPAATGCLTPPPITVESQTIDFSMVSMGNPHAVIQVADVETAAVAGIGAAMQQYFSDGVNVGFAQVIDRQSLRLRVWERGAGETLACGSGACAAAVAAIAAGLVAPEVAVDLPGGQLVVKWDGSGKPVWLRGPAQRVFEGQKGL